MLTWAALHSRATIRGQPRALDIAGPSSGAFTLGRELSMAAARDIMLAIPSELGITACGSVPSDRPALTSSLAA